MTQSLFNWTFLKMTQSVELQPGSVHCHKYVTAESKITDYSTGHLSGIVALCSQKKNMKKSEGRLFKKQNQKNRLTHSNIHLLWNTSSSARWELDSVLAFPHIKKKWKTHQTWYKLPLNWRRMEMHIMFNTFISSWQLCSGFSVKYLPHEPLSSPLAYTFK